MKLTLGYILYVTSQRFNIKVEPNKYYNHKNGLDICFILSFLTYESGEFSQKVILESTILVIKKQRFGGKQKRWILLDSLGQHTCLKY